MAPLMDWPDDLGYGMLTGRIGYMDGDHNDSDRKPDMNAVTGGSVMIEPSVKAVRYTGVGGPIILTARKTMGVIDDQGYICTPAAPGETPSRGIVVPATDDEQLNPTNFTYKVTITAPNFSLSPFNIAVPTGSTQDLTLIAPVPASGGTATVVDVSTAIRAEDAAARAESIADGLDQAIADAVATGDWTGPQGRGIVSITDDDQNGSATVTFTDGTTSELILPRGLKGDTGDRGPSGPSGGMGSTFLHGPGRPDQPVTTAGIITGSEVVGTTYTSTDGAGVGAWVWRKRPTGWAVVDGDTGWVFLGVDQFAQPGIGGGIRRVGDFVQLNLENVPRVYNQVIYTYPTGFRGEAKLNVGGQAKGRGTVISSTATTSNGLYIVPLLFLGTEVKYGGVAVSDTQLNANISHFVRRGEPWPSALPGPVSLV